MSAQNRTTLKGYFNTNDQPTESNFADLIDSFLLFSGGDPAAFSGLVVSADAIRITTAKTPATAGAAGTQGDFCWDGTHFYICTATNTWRRAAHATW